jgi:NADH:ubiquinone oxidoreductase subunit K
MSIHYFLIVGLLLFLIGIYGVLTRRNAIGILMGIELMFNGVNINLVAFSNDLQGHIFAIFVIVLAAAESAIGLALILSIYRHVKTVYTERMNIMKG